MKSEEEETRQLTWTAPDAKKLGIEQAEYKGHTILIKPVGSFEYDAIIDGKTNIGGNDDFCSTESFAIWHIDELEAGRDPFRKLEYGVQVTYCP